MTTIIGTILTIVGIIALAIFLPSFAIIVAYESYTMKDTPEWLEQAYRVVEDIIWNIFR